MGGSNSDRFSPLSSVLGLLSTICGSFRRLMLRVVAVGPIPKHIAIIMDGNRRFADRSGLERSRGHLYGYDRLISTLENCLELGVKYVSVYAFSIDNFGRPQDEVNSLMSLMEEKLDHLVTKHSLLNDYGVRVQVLGDLTLLPVNVRAAAERAMAATKEYRSVVLNLCVAYTSTAEIVHSVQEMRDDILMTSSETIPCDSHSLNGQLHLKSVRWRGTNGFKPENPVPTNGTFARGNCNAEIHPNDHAFILKNWAKRTADAALDSNGELNHDLSVSESRNGTILDESVKMKSIKPGNGKARIELHSKLATECPGADLASCRSARDFSDVLERRIEPCALVESITVKDIESHLYTAGCPPPDVLIRTSGETRLSNFMLWQCSSYSRLAFCKVLWPDFSLTDLAWIILDYQRAFPALQKQRRLQELIPGLDSKDL